MSNMIDINQNKPHYVAELMCINCGHRGIHTFPTDCWLQELECPKCGKSGYIITTGQILDYNEFDECITDNSKKISKPGTILQGKFNKGGKQ